MSWPSIIQNIDKMHKHNREQKSQVEHEEKNLKNGQTSLNRFKPKQRIPTIEELQDDNKGNKMKDKLKGYKKFKEYSEAREDQIGGELQKGMRYQSGGPMTHGGFGKAREMFPGRGKGEREQFGKTRPTGAESPTKETLQTSKTPTFKPGEAVGSINAGATKQVNDNLVNKNKRAVKSKYGQGVQTNSGTRDPDRKGPGLFQRIGGFFSQDDTMHTNYIATKNAKGKEKTPLFGEEVSALSKIKRLFQQSNLGEGIEVSELFGKTGKAEVEKSECGKKKKEFLITSGKK